MVDADCLPFGSNPISLFGCPIYGSLVRHRSHDRASEWPTRCRSVASGDFLQRRPGRKDFASCLRRLRGLRLTSLARGGSEVARGGTSEKDLSEWRK